MSAVTGVSSSDSAAYATQLAQTSAIERSLYNLGNAVESGDLTSAGSILTAFMQANPQYASTSSDSSQSQDPINQDFQTLATAISNNQVGAAQSAWTQVKSDLANAGVTNLGNPAAATAQLLAQTKSSISQEILSDTFGSSSGSSLSVASLIGGTSGSDSTAGLSSSLIGNWLTYQEGGTTSPPASSDSTGTNLDATA
jgi:hypothetical protein